MGCSRAPRILFSVDHGEARVGDCKAAVFVDGFGVGRVVMLKASTQIMDS